MTASKPKPRRGRAARGPSARATIREIAGEAGVSTATVSRFMNQPERVGARNRERIAEVIERHHYISDGMAGGLASRRSKLLGLVIPTITNSIYALSTQAVQQTAQAAGYTVLVGISNFVPAQEALHIRKLLERRVDGLVLTGAARSAKLLETIRHNGVPFVITWKLAAGSALPCVSFDNHKAAAQAVAHLVGLGHRRIALICGRSTVNDRARGRREGFEAAMAAHGLAVDEALIHERDFEFDAGRAAMSRMLALSAPPSAVFCANDIQAIGAMYECRESGLAVPADISIVGFDDLPISQYTAPQLTTIRVPAAEMGQRATEALLRAIEGQGPVFGEELSTRLIRRGSTAPCRAAQ